MTAFVIPNAIQLSTRQAKTFGSRLDLKMLLVIGSKSQSSMDSPGAVEAGAAVEIVAGVNGIVVVPLKKADVVCLWQR